MMNTAKIASAMTVSGRSIKARSSRSHSQKRLNFVVLLHRDIGFALTRPFGLAIEISERLYENFVILGTRLLANRIRNSQVQRVNLAVTQD